ncbi:MAG TPA: hypothetical protein PKE57_03285 [Cellvibrionaceae bacterium]|nr:hypothetical protein [Cellvibrionaceae bacterium]HMW49005.1 hypothetical protein [Cellvibrionaceae bacterium]HNG61187.1 hypothetical protein [Cellvibrionaceae bacterium]
MSKYFWKMLPIAAACISGFSHAGSVSGTISQVMAGQDNWYGVRFYLNITNNQTNGECNPSFVYVEPEAGSGYQAKVSVFLAAYLAGKTVDMTVTAGRGGYCKIFEGVMR